MKGIVVKLDRALLKADATYDAANNKALTALVKSLKPGRRVEWFHGDRLHAGTVVKVHGYHYKHATVDVASDSSKEEITVPASAIVSFIRGACAS